MSNVRHIIEAATPGPWEAKFSGVAYYPYIEHEGKDIASFDRTVNSEFCATFDPEHVALMEAVIAAARKRFEEWTTDTYAELDDALKALGAYRKERGLTG